METPAHTTAQRNLFAVICGPALFWTWFYACFSTRLIYRDFPTAFDAGNMGLLLGQASVVLAVIMLCAFRKTSSNVLAPRSVLASAGVLSLFTMLQLVTLPNDTLQTAFFVITGIIAGGAIPPVATAWGARQTLERSSLPLAIAGSFLLANVLFVAILLIPTQIALPVTVLLPLISGAIWFHDGKRRRTVDSDAELSEGDVNIRQLPWAPLSVFCITCLACEITAYVLSIRSTEINFAGIGLGSLLTIALCLAVMLVFARKRRKISLTTVYLAFAPFITAVLLVQLMVGDGFYSISSQLLHVFTLMLQVMLWIFLADIAERKGFSPLSVFGLGIGIMSSLACLSNLIGRMLVNTGAWSPTIVKVLCCTLLLVITSSLAFLLAVGQHAEAKRRRSAISVLPTAMRAEADTAADGHTEPATDLSSFDNVQDAWDRAFALKADRFSADHDLSARETEIIRYLLKGLSAPHIGQQLFVTTGTIKSHVAHIYAKTGVHSRSELIDSFEHFE